MGDTAHHGPAQRPPLRVVGPRRRVSLPWVALGVVLIVGGGLAAVLVMGRAEQRQTVLAIARPVQVGQRIQVSDLTTARLPADAGLAVLDADAQASVVGRPAATTLLPGMLLVPAAVGQPARLEPGVGLAGVALEPGRYPPGVSAGVQVRVVDTGSGGQGAGGQQPGGILVDQATVVGVHTQPAETGSGTVVTLQVPLTTAEPVTTAAAAGRLALVLVGPEAS